MARTTIAVQALLGSRPTTPLTAGTMDIVLTAADITNLNQAAFGNYSQLLLLAYNADVGSVTMTVTSAVDPFNRTGDITAYAMQTLDYTANVFGVVGWRQTDGYLYFQASDVDVKFAVLGF